MKTPNALFPLILLFPLLLKAQLQGQQRVDSLIVVLEKSQDHQKKVSTLRELFNVQLYIEPSVAKTHALQILDVSQENDYVKGTAIGNYCLGNYYMITQSVDSSSIYYRKTMELAKEFTDDILYINSLSNLSLIEGEKGNYDSAIVLGDSAINMYLKNKYYFQYGIALGDLANTYINKGDYENATIGTINALKVLDTIDKEPFRIADLHRQLGKINYFQGNYAKSLSDFKQALKVYKSTSDNLYEAYTLVDIGNSLVEMENYEEAIQEYQKSKAISEKFGFTDNTANVFSNLGMVYTKQGRYDLAITNLLRGIEINKTRNSYFNIISASGEIGNAYAMKGDFTKALAFLNRTIQLADSIQALDQLKLALNYRSKALKMSGNYKEALEDQLRFKKISDSLFSIERTKEIEGLQIAFETEKKEAEIALQREEIKTLNEKAKVDKLTKGLFAGGMASALALSGLLVFGFRQRIKKNRVEKEKITKELEHKQKELTSQTLHLVQKSQFIAELKENLENLKSSPEKFKIEFKRIVMLLKKQSAADKDWEVFKSYFSEVHHDFETQLKALSNKVTDKELRLASYVKMGLNNNEIANILNVLPASIHTSKYRLKQKLHIDKDLDFDSFIKGL